MNTLYDLGIVTYDGQRWFEFSIGHCDDFAETLALLKEIPRRERSFDAETKRWRVLVSEENELALDDIFDNFTAQLEALDAQLELPLD